jgi:hypothetical protein
MPEAVNNKGDGGSLELGFEPKFQDAQDKNSSASIH